MMRGSESMIYSVFTVINGSLFPNLLELTAIALAFLTRYQGQPPLLPVRLLLPWQLSHLTTPA